MNEYAVWDNSEYRKGFIDLKNQQIILNLLNGGLKGLYGGDGYMKDWQLFKSIGMQDVNEKEIYADCSIVEFGYKVGTAKHIGFFFYDNETLSYKLEILSNKFNGEKWNFCSSMNDFKIIDTIQENKLGLINESKS